MKKRYERYKRGAEMQRDEVEDRVESMGVKAWGEQIATQKNLNKHLKKKQYKLSIVFLV